MAGNRRTPRTAMTAHLVALAEHRGTESTHAANRHRAYYKGNYPEQASPSGRRSVRISAAISTRPLSPPRLFWDPADRAGKTFRPIAVHDIEGNPRSRPRSGPPHYPPEHFPDGGISRLRLFGMIAWTTRDDTAHDRSDPRTNH